MNEPQYKRWRRNNPKRAREISLKAVRKYRLKKYGFSEELYKMLWIKQKGLCALPSCKKPAQVPDHCHLTGRPRGLLCSNHNVALGLFKDNINALNDAVKYLEAFAAAA